MREILFRGKTYDGEWVEGDYLNGGYDYKTAIRRKAFDGGVHYAEVIKVIPETVVQYTGLTDKNGKKIFEGDILEHKVQSDILINRGVVNWDCGNTRWALQLNTMNPCFYMHNPEAVEIIGNIYDNPELLKGGADNG